MSFTHLVGCGRQQAYPNFTIEGGRIRNFESRVRARGLGRKFPGGVRGPIIGMQQLKQNVKLMRSISTVILKKI